LVPRARLELARLAALDFESSASTDSAIGAFGKGRDYGRRACIRGQRIIRALMKTSDFDYHLPDTLIARYPLARRDASRLLHVDAIKETYTDRLFAELPDFFRAGDLLVFNDTRVIKARLYGEKSSGGKIEALVERVLNEHEALLFMRASKSPKPGAQIRFADAIAAEVMEREGDLFRVASTRPARCWNGSRNTARCRCRLTCPGPPKPPTIPAIRPSTPGIPARWRRPRRACISTRPCWPRCGTLGVSTAFVTLHVGAGTFQPVRAETLAEHVMHTERYAIPEATLAAVARRNNAAAASARWAPPACAHWNPPPATVSYCAPARARPICSSRRVPFQGGGTAADQLPSAEIDPADAGLGLWRQPNCCARRMPMPWRSNTAFSATAMRC
jgi:hypothetical protein